MVLEVHREPRILGLEEFSPDARTLLEGGNVGRSEVIPLGVTTQQAAITLLEIKGPSELARPISVTLLPPFESDEAILGNAAFAAVSWGNGGVRATAVMDFGRGVSFTCHGAWLRVAAFRDANGLASGARWGAFASLKSINSKHSPTLTQNVGNILAGATSSVFVPNFAKSYQVFAGDVFNAMRIRVVNSALAASQTFQLGAGVLQSEPAELPNAAFRIDITNNGVAPVTAHVVHHLSI